MNIRVLLKNSFQEICKVIVRGRWVMKLVQLAGKKGENSFGLYQE